MLSHPCGVLVGNGRFRSVGGQGRRRNDEEHQRRAYKSRQLSAGVVRDDGMKPAYDASGLLRSCAVNSGGPAEIEHAVQRFDLVPGDRLKLEIGIEADDLAATLDVRRNSLDHVAEPGQVGAPERTDA